MRNTTMDCVKQFTFNIFEINPVFTNALDAYDYAKSNDFNCGSDVRQMDYAEKVKYCRWLNGSRCTDLTQILIPSFTNVELQ